MNLYDHVIAPLPYSYSLAVGSIYNKRLELGHILGNPVDYTIRELDDGGYYQRFQGGVVYYSPTTGAHEVHGAILGKWADLGWERSFLGYPTTDESPTPDGVGRFNHFQGGSIYWTAQTGAHTIYGDIFGKWADLGHENSFLGYPVTDELDAPDGEDDFRAFQNGRYSAFQGGLIHWQPIQDITNYIDQKLDKDSQEKREKCQNSNPEDDPKNCNIQIVRTGATEFTRVHEFYEYNGQPYYNVLELDADLKAKVKGPDPDVDLDLFLSLSIENGKLEVTTVNAKVDVNYPWWAKVVSGLTGSIVGAITGGVVGAIAGGIAGGITLDKVGNSIAGKEAKNEEGKCDDIPLKTGDPNIDNNILPIDAKFQEDGDIIVVGVPNQNHNLLAHQTNNISDCSRFSQLNTDNTLGSSFSHAVNEPESVFMNPLLQGIPNLVNDSLLALSA
jgi:hypothetical protein